MAEEEGQRRSLCSARVRVGPLTRRLTLRDVATRGGRGEGRGRSLILPLFAARAHQRGIVGAGDDAEWYCGARRRLLVRVALPEGRQLPASQGDDDTMTTTDDGDGNGSTSNDDGNGTKGYA